MSPYTDEQQAALANYGGLGEDLEDHIFTVAVMERLTAEADRWLVAVRVATICYRMALMERSRGRPDAPVEEWRDVILRQAVPGECAAEERPALTMEEIRQLACGRHGVLRNFLSNEELDQFIRDAARWVGGSTCVTRAEE